MGPITSTESPAIFKKIGKIALYSTLLLSLLANAYLYNLALYWFDFAKKENVVIHLIANHCGVERAQQ
jgi:hypothetical protein